MHFNYFWGYKKFKLNIMIKMDSKTLKAGPISFNKWSNKNYSVFNTLKRVVRISTLSAAYSIVLLPVQLLAQTDTSKITKNLDLEEVVVSAQRSPVVYSKLARIVTIIDESDVSQLPVISINELIENSSFVDIRQRSTNGVQADISIRGGTFDQNLILLNGINISDPQTGHHSLNLPIDLNSVSRIEILEGSGSRVFGPNAFSGAINIITNQSEKNYLKTSFTAGDFGLFSTTLSGNVNYKKLGQFLAVSKSISGGYTQNTDFDNLNVFYNPYLNAAIGKFDFQIGYTNKSFGANSFYTPEYPNQYEQIKTTFASLKFETGKTIKFIPAVYYRAHKDRFELFRNNPAVWYTGHNYHFTQVYGAKIDTRFAWDFGNTSIGADYRSENILSNKLGEPMNDTIKAYGEPDGFYTMQYSRNISNLFIEHSIYFNRLSLTAGILGSYIYDKEKSLNFYPGMDVGYEISKSLKFYTSVNKSLRLPTFTDLFYNGPKNTGNPDLKPEEAWSYEGGFKYFTKIASSNISIFYRDSKNLIEWVKDTADVKWKTENLTNVQTLGFQFSTKINFSSIWRKSILKTLNINYAYLNQSIEKSNFETKYSLNYLKHNLNLTVFGSLFKSLDMSWNFKFQDRAGVYQPYDFENKIYKPETDFDPFFTVDAKIIWNYKWLKLYTEATNIFNIQYIDFGNLEMPGRWFKAGLELNLEW